MIFSPLPKSRSIYDFLVPDWSEAKMNPVMLVDVIWSPNWCSYLSSCYLASVAKQLHCLQALMLINWWSELEQVKFSFIHLEKCVSLANLAKNVIWAVSTDISFSNFHLHIVFMNILFLHNTWLPRAQYWVSYSFNKFFVGSALKCLFHCSLGGLIISHL